MAYRASPWVGSGIYGARDTMKVAAKESADV
jgi:hypothetical protein